MDLAPFLNDLRVMLPPQWELEVTEADTRAQDSRADAVLTLTASDGSAGQLLVELKPRVSARQAAQIAAIISSAGQGADGILFTRYASRMARDRLRKAGVSYLDLTGNAWIRLDQPAVFIQRQGADTDPDPPRRGVQSLKGAKAARILRALCDWRPPLGVRELARKTNANPGYVTRVLSLLADEDVISRDSTGEVREVRWQDLLLRWSIDYSLTNTNRPLTCLAPRGLAGLKDRLATFNGPYAVTGSFAVPAEAQVASRRILSCYVPAPELAAQELDLRRADTAANVLLIEPFDELVFERTREEAGLTAVALSQCVVDLLTGTGREPTQAEALMVWMADNEDVWRT